MSERVAYSRVYWSIIDDAKFASVYDDDRALACWLRLLLAADQSWPASPSLPGTVRRAPLAALISAELIDRQAGGRYRVHGLDAERDRRKAAATRGTPEAPPTGPQLGPNWVSQPNPERPATTGLSLAEPSRDEPSQAEGARDPADAYWSLTGRYPQDSLLKWIDDLAQRYGADATIRALAECHAKSGDTRSLLGRVRDVLAKRDRELDRAEAATEKARLAEKRAQPKIVEPWKAEFRQALERQSHERGYHADEPDPGCPSCRSVA